MRRTVMPTSKKQHLTTNALVLVGILSSSSPKTISLFLHSSASQHQDLVTAVKLARDTFFAIYASATSFEEASTEYLARDRILIASFDTTQADFSHYQHDPMFLVLLTGFVAHPGQRTTGRQVGNSNL